MASEANDAGALALISFDEVKKHSYSGDCWVVVNGQVYDLSAFDHPGGSESESEVRSKSLEVNLLTDERLLVILKYAGGDATTAFNEIHAPGILKALRPDQVRGPIDADSIPVQEQTSTVVNTSRDGSPSSSAASKPPLHSLISVHDFEKIARQTYTAKTMAFYSSAATDLVSHRANSQCQRQLLLRPRVLRNVRETSTKRRILGCDSSAPFFVR